LSNPPSSAARANKSWAIKVDRLNWKICRIFLINFCRSTASADKQKSIVCIRLYSKTMRCFRFEISLIPSDLDLWPVCPKLYVRRSWSFYEHPILDFWARKRYYMDGRTDGQHSSVIRPARGTLWMTGRLCLTTETIRHWLHPVLLNLFLVSYRYLDEAIWLYIQQSAISHYHFW